MSRTPLPILYANNPEWIAFDDDRPPIKQPVTVLLRIIGIDRTTYFVRIKAILDFGGLFPYPDGSEPIDYFYQNSSISAIAWRIPDETDN